MRKAKRRKIARLKTKLGLPDLEQAESVLKQGGLDRKSVV